MNRFAITLPFLLAATFAALPARGDATDRFGLDARSKGMANAVTSLSTDWSAATHNPAGAAMAHRVSVGAGYSYSYARAAINGRNAGLLDIRGVGLGVTAPFDLPGNLRIAFGLTAYLPDQFLARVQLVPAYEPRFVLMDNSPNRIVLTPVVALKVWRYLSLGAGATVLADAAGNGIQFNVGVKGGVKVGESALDVTLPTRAAPVAGLLFGPIAGFAVGILYRAAIDIRVALDIVANVDVAGIVTGDAVIVMRALNCYTPHKLVAGASYTWDDRLAVAATLTWYGWSRFKSGIPVLRIMVDLGLNPPMLQTSYPSDNFHDTLSVRVGAEYRLKLARKRKHRMFFRAGYFFEPTPVPTQVGMSALLDNDRHGVTAGWGVYFRPLARAFPYGLSVDLAFQYHNLVERKDTRNLRWTGLGGGGIVYGGHLFHVALSGSLEF